VEALDSYLHKQAGQDARKRAAVPFVATTDGQTIAGYYTLSQFAIGLDAIPEQVAKRLPKYPMVSATLLGRLAVSTEFRGRGLGEILLMDALHRSLDSSKQIASAGVIVDARDESAAGFYRRYGFVELPKIEKRLFLPMGTVERLFRKGRWRAWHRLRTDNETRDRSSQQERHLDGISTTPAQDIHFLESYRGKFSSNRFYRFSFACLLRVRHSQQSSRTRRRFASCHARPRTCCAA